MKATEATKDWKTLSEFVWNRVNGNDTEPLSDEDCEAINKAVPAIVEDVGVDSLQVKVGKVMNVNILDKNVKFDIFEQIPNLWKVYYGFAISAVASACGQIIVGN